MPFAYDKVRLCVSSFHPNAITKKLDDHINKLATTIHNEKGFVDAVLHKSLTSKAKSIHHTIYKYLNSHFDTDLGGSKAPVGKKLKERGLEYTMKVAKFSRFWDVSRAVQLQPSNVSLLPFANLIHTVGVDKIHALSQESPKYLELARFRRR